jgi:precorrin-6A synthase
LVIGIGPGDPSQVTIQAVRGLNDADVVFEIERGARYLTDVRREILTRYMDHDPRIVPLHEPPRDRSDQPAAAYGAAVQDWRSARADVWEHAIADEVPDDGCAAFLVWGDPSLYDSTIAVLDDVRERGHIAFSYEVIPGISSIHALTARHGISLNRVGSAVQITTGRRLIDHGWPAGVDDVVVMLDSGGAFRAVIDLDLTIYWGAYLGTPDEILISGPLAEVAGEIERVRAEARERHGWVMDAYLLRSRACE